jgi:hypothetical protein
MLRLMKRGGYLLLLGACAFAAQPSLAQTTDTSYKLTEINFDMWCQEQQHLPPDRCDQRLPEDEKAFEAYVDTIQKYEIPYLRERNKREEYNRTFLHNDPVDNPTQPSTPPMQPINSAPPK